MASAHGMEVESCAETIDLADCGVRHGSCIDAVLIERLAGAGIKVKKDPSQRAACGCVASVDIGSYDTCRNGCVYCYATRSDRAVASACARYDVDSPLLCDALREDDVVRDRKSSRCSSGNWAWESRTPRPGTPAVGMPAMMAPAGEAATIRLRAPRAPRSEARLRTRRGKCNTRPRPSGPRRSSPGCRAACPRALPNHPSSRLSINPASWSARLTSCARRARGMEPDSLQPRRILLMGSDLVVLGHGLPDLRFYVRAIGHRALIQVEGGVDGRPAPGPAFQLPVDEPLDGRDLGRRSRRSPRDVGLWHAEVPFVASLSIVNV